MGDGRTLTAEEVELDDLRRPYTIAEDDLSGLCRTKIDSVGKCIVRQQRCKSKGRGVGWLAGTTNWVRDRGRGETNDELRRLRSTRSKMPKVKTHSMLALSKATSAAIRFSERGL